MVAHPLPSQTTPFIGRTGELAEIARLLAEPNCRLLTLVGPGGIGKTRLALEAAGLLSRNFPQGVAFVPLVSVNAPEGLIWAIADVIGFSFFPGSEPRQQLFDVLRGRELLLVLDNFEHLLGARPSCWNSSGPRPA